MIDFITKAVIAGIAISSVCGITSVFIILNKNVFAAHAFGHTSLTGAAAATLYGISSIYGQLIGNCITAILLGIIGDKIQKNDMAVGVVLSIMLGLSGYFLSQNHISNNISGILFGSIFAITVNQLFFIVGFVIFTITMLLYIQRGFLFSIFEPEIAKVYKINTKIILTVFYILLAITVSVASILVGNLFVFILLVLPGAIATRVSKNIYCMMALSVAIATTATAISIYLSYIYDISVSGAIVGILTAIFFLIPLVKIFYNCCIIKSCNFM